jgi:redox-sensitive bicupin YhaK (pirin superfamily)
MNWRAFIVIFIGVLGGLYFRTRTNNNHEGDDKMMKNAVRSVSRTIAKKVFAPERPEGAGALVRRSIGTREMRHFTPFLMLDHLVSAGKGFPDHPHRGQETITYVLRGNVDHEDFTGSKGTIGPGDLQFMTAGRGIVHAEMPRVDEDGRTPEMMQLWVDLPEELKDTEPRYRDLLANEIPIVNPDDKVEVRVISGEAYGVKSVQDLAYTPVVFYDYKIRPGGFIRQPVPEDFNVFLYVMKGSIRVNGQEKVDQFYNAAFNDEGNSIDISVNESSEEEARFILVGGKKLDQEIYQNGPFVETTKEKIQRAFFDFKACVNGFERASKWQSEIGKRMK